MSTFNSIAIKVIRIIECCTLWNVRNERAYRTLLCTSKWRVSCKLVYVWGLDVIWNDHNTCAIYFDWNPIWFLFSLICAHIFWLNIGNANMQKKNKQTTKSSICLLQRNIDFIKCWPVAMVFNQSVSTQAKLILTAKAGKIEMLE